MWPKQNHKQPEVKRAFKKKRIYWWNFDHKPIFVSLDWDEIGVDCGPGSLIWHYSQFSSLRITLELLFSMPSWLVSFTFDFDKPFVFRRLSLGCRLFLSNSASLQDVFCIFFLAIPSGQPVLMLVSLFSFSLLICRTVPRHRAPLLLSIVVNSQGLEAVV